MSNLELGMRLTTLLTQLALHDCFYRINTGIGFTLDCKPAARKEIEDELKELIKDYNLG